MVEQGRSEPELCDFLVGLNVNFILNDHFWQIFSSNIHSITFLPKLLPFCHSLSRMEGIA